MDSMVQLISDLDRHGPVPLSSFKFYMAVAERGYVGLARDEWLIAPDKAFATRDFGCEVLYHGRMGTFDRRDSFFLEREGVLATVFTSDGEFGITVACQGPDLASAEELIEHFRELIPPNPPPPVDSIYLTFWALGPMGPMRVRRRITVPSWEDIDKNYPTPTDGRVAELMANFIPSTGGQLLLLHGVAGTGKTYAIRALGREWRDWCSFEYITDPEAFFGDAGYMMNVLMQLGSGGGDGQPAAAVEDGTEKAQEKPQGRWQLLILEDTGELLTSDAKMRSGQGLSRFLNLADGLIGQGLNLLILVTTNEPLRELHAAVQRPGRCAANIEFGRFTEEVARGWLRGHGCDYDPGGKKTLADLYGILAGQKVEQTRPIGLGV